LVANGYRQRNVPINRDAEQIVGRERRLRDSQIYMLIQL
jgi:hypothetical protein